MLSADSGISLIKSLPADRLLTETDAPFTEIENRKSEPRDVTGMISRLAQLRNLSVEEMKRTVTSNAERVLAFAGVSIPSQTGNPSPIAAHNGRSSRRGGFMV